MSDVDVPRVGDPADIDFLAPEAVVDPHSYFGARRDVDPIQWSARHRAWIVMGHPELR